MRRSPAPRRRTPLLRRLRSRLAVVALAAAALAGAAPPVAGQEQAAAGSLVLITLDTTRADHLGAWGWPHARTPHLDALARRGARFVRCDAAAPITLPSHSSILSGLYPPRHGVRDNATFVLSGDVETVPEQLAAAGWDTGAVVSAVVLARHYGLAQGFRLYDDDLGTGYRDASTTAERPAEATTDAALAQLAKLRPPYFLWVHYFDPHDDYVAPEPFAGRATGPHRAYDGEIAYMDHEIGRLLAALPEEVTVVVVGDHGEMLGDQGELTHGLLLGPGSRRVPLLIAGPGIPAGRRVDCLTRTVDVAPTLVELAGLVPTAGLDGSSLVPLATGAEQADGEGACGRLSYSESFLPFFAYRWYPLRSLSSDRWLYLHGTRPGLFDLAADPDETDDLAARYPDRVARWRDRLTSFVGELGGSLDGPVGPTRTLGGEERARLESLGYLGGTASAGSVERGLPDPRDMTDVDRAIKTGAALVRQERYSEAVKTLYRLLERDPANFPALNLSGLALQGAGRFESALSAFRRAAEANPRSAVPRVNAAGCLLQLGRTEEAESELRQAMELDPTAAGGAANLAILLRQKGRPTEAAAVLERALAAGSRHPGIFLERGRLAAAAGDLAAAFADFEEATRRAPDDPGAVEAAALAAMRLGRWADAARHFTGLAELVPDRPAIWGTLGSLYLDRLDDPIAARRAFERALELESDPGKRSQLEAILARLR